MNAFITGSHAYGEPREDSDIDLVVLADVDTQRFLREHNESKNPNVVRFGKLNIILVSNDADYAAWKAGTSMCVHKRAETCEPVNREAAKELLDKLRASMGLAYFGISPSDC